ncbi:MAG: hypothetical protein BGO68_00115 [Candidatus Amoebophilus sp. 36-38]|nr:MAG: hypothetical protein BGO68_00115 [Candidatus Amoebophilus sp. 36-38]
MQFKNITLSLIVLIASFTISYAQKGNPPSTNTQKNEAGPESQPSTQHDEDEDKEFKDKLKEQRKLELENALIRTRLERELAELRAEIERIRVQREAAAVKWELEQAKITKEFEQQVFILNRQRDKIMAEVSLSQAKLSQTMDRFNTTYTELQNHMMLLRAGIDQIRTEIDQKKVKKERAAYADGECNYLDEPLLPDGTLVLSDRTVTLNGVVTEWKANYITDRIRYFNNKDKKKPIFIVIDSSPGGSVLAGFNILQAMQNSQAPVYVVVKSFAASMAALITTLAKKSYVYPNALILHHQPWTFGVGNLRELKEDLERLQEIWKRLGGQVAKKMGISLDKFDKQLYEKASRGDWLEFADNAKKTKWVDHIITTIDDTAIREIPDRANYTWQKHMEEYWDMKVDANNVNASTIYLPSLGPKDFYYLYNPDNTYQLRTNN